MSKHVGAEAGAITTRRYERHATGYEQVRSPESSHEWDGDIIVRSILKNGSGPWEKEG